MPGISIHVIDVSRGVVAAGMQVELHALEAEGKLKKIVAKRAIGAKGMLKQTELSDTFPPRRHLRGFSCRRVLPRTGCQVAHRTLPRCRALPFRYRRPGAALSPAVQMHALGLFVLPRGRLTGNRQTKRRLRKRPAQRYNAAAKRRY